MKVAVPGRRSTVEETPEGLRIVLPARRNWFLLIFLGAWLVGWAVGEGTAAYSLLTGGTKGGTLFVTAWLVGWTVGGALIIHTWLWCAVGREIVLLRPDFLVHKREVAGLGRTREYALADVKRLRIDRPSRSVWEWGASSEIWGLSGGAIAFDYGAKTFHLAAGADEAEALQIIADLRRRHSFGERAA